MNTKLPIYGIRGSIYCGARDWPIKQATIRNFEKLLTFRVYMWIMLRPEATQYIHSLKNKLPRILRGPITVYEDKT